MHEITRHAAELVGIESHLDYAPHELSGGQKQRVSLAGVMVDQVKILLFDEPLANLDPAAGKQAIDANIIYENGLVDFCHPDFIMRITQFLNDPLYSEQYYLRGVL